MRGIWVVWILLMSAGLMWAQSPEAVVTRTLQAYAKAIESRDLDRIETLVDTTAAFTVFEGGHVNQGWWDYRDHHLAPELKAFKAIEYRFSNIQVIANGELAVATLRYAIRVTLPDRTVSADGVGTFVLVRQSDGWKIRHIHTTRSPKKH